jgi:hypothetical protein
MRIYKADLHIHTCLSPCAELDMSPRTIIRTALAAGLDLLGICDHNACDNVPAVKLAAHRTPLEVLGGMEITSQEEVHLLAYFDEDEDLFAVQKELHACLVDTTEARWRDEQVIAGAEDEVLGFHSKLLIGAVQLSLKEIVDLVHRNKGLAVASHVDREGFGIIGQLGFIPPNLPLDAVEVRSKDSPLIKDLRLPVLTSSDAHRPEEIGRSTMLLTLESPTVAEIREALKGFGGRKVAL